MRIGTHRFGPFVWCLHFSGGWIRTGHGEGAGWCINGPRLPPLFSERNGRGQRVVLSVRGWRLKRLASITSALLDVSEDLARARSMTLEEAAVALPKPHPTFSQSGDSPTPATGGNTNG